MMRLGGKGADLPIPSKIEEQDKSTSQINKQQTPSELDFGVVGGKLYCYLDQVIIFSCFFFFVFCFFLFFFFIIFIVIYYFGIVCFFCLFIYLFFVFMLISLQICRQNTKKALLASGHKNMLSTHDWILDRVNSVKTNVDRTGNSCFSGFDLFLLLFVK
jgi:hypothetical protein